MVSATRQRVLLAGIRLHGMSAASGVGRAERIRQSGGEATISVHRSKETHVAAQARDVVRLPATYSTADDTADVARSLAALPQSARPVQETESPRPRTAAGRGAGVDYVCLLEQVSVFLFTPGGLDDQFDDAVMEAVVKAARDGGASYPRRPWPRFFGPRSTWSKKADALHLRNLRRAVASRFEATVAKMRETARLRPLFRPGGNRTARTTPTEYRAIRKRTLSVFGIRRAERTTSAPVVREHAGRTDCSVRLPDHGVSQSPPVGLQAPMIDFFSTRACRQTPIACSRQPALRIRGRYRP